MSDTFDPNEAVAFLHCNMPDGTQSTDIFRESDNNERDPFHRASRLRDAVRDDFPGAVFSIGVNKRANDLATVTRMRAMGFEDYTLADAAEDGVL